MASTLRIIVILLTILPSNFPSLVAQTWIKAGYWYPRRGISISDINSNLFTHLFCAYAVLNDSTYELSVSPSDQNSFSSFSTTVKQKNPSVITILSIGGFVTNFSSMAVQVSHRKSFINSSINLARKYGFEGLDFMSWPLAETDADMSNIGTLLQEWRIAIESESRTKNISKLILTKAAQYVPHDFEPLESIRKNLDWIYVVNAEYYIPTLGNKTGASAALYDPASNVNTDYGIHSWIRSGMPSNKIVLSLPFYGYAWTLEDPKNNAVGAPATGAGVTVNGFMSYNDIKDYIRRYNGVSSYNGTYVMRYCSIGSIWIGFDDAEVVKMKVSYAKEMNLRGYVAWQVSCDDNWELSQAASGVENSGKNHQSKWHMLLKIFLPIATVIIILVIGIAMWYNREKFMVLQERKAERKMKLKSRNYHMTAIRSRDSHESLMFSFDEIKTATNNFSSENKLGEGGYGPVYKGKLRNGQEVAVKRLSETSKQGFEEFKNELLLNEGVQHVNLVMVLGFCVERDEKMLIYEYMTNKSLDFYIFDPLRRYFLDWEKRIGIIEGVTQGLLYLHEYSRLKIIHRDLKASNILLDSQMKPKISDFGLARIFQKDEFEANTGHIVGTYGYVPPEYVRQGIYSTKSDVFGFGVLLLQIISGRKNTCFYGPQSNLNLLEYAYELWKDGRGKEFMDESLHDSSSSCKLIRCMQIALQCVQEDPLDRPTMLEISQMLKNDQNIVMKCPKRPAFSNRKDDDGEKMPISSSGGRTDLIDTATITTVVAR